MLESDIDEDVASVHISFARTGAFSLGILEQANAKAPFTSFISPNLRVYTNAIAYLISRFFPIARDFAEYPNSLSTPSSSTQLPIQFVSDPSSRPPNGNNIRRVWPGIDGLPKTMEMVCRLSATGRALNVSVDGHVAYMSAVCSLLASVYSDDRMEDWEDALGASCRRKDMPVRHEIIGSLCAAMRADYNNSVIDPQAGFFEDGDDSDERRIESMTPFRPDQYE